ncbi:dipeptidyl aminopeptidase/acylaminoacyl peptidase [Mesonia hippocampi]|uniref:Dipeptidyl aminopeptidase/acylaminoacyl peptidase n=1 Tax=Mesonia hippocampi TaxID=1628250 RepID=A0A840EPD9_9FLAO|nr:prolyl oligopeptidase family serine peptidase [Mesonia hippocampi]MBB4120008.1 dipeptidyl aminopeptidase/acylaminoacyl peptidase [Mesonia hippocampi]
MKCKIKILLITFSLFLYFGNISLYGQVQKYSVEKDSLWENLYLLGVSKDNKWIHYSTHHFIGDNEVTSIKHIETGKTLDFSGGYWGSFNDKWFCIRSGSDSLLMVDLLKKSVDTINRVKSYHLSTSSNHLLVQTLSDTLELRNLVTKQSYKLDKSLTYSLNPTNEVLAVVLHKNGRESLFIYDLNTLKGHKIMSGKNSSFQRLTWNATGEKLGVLYNSKDKKAHHLAYYNLKEGTIEHLTSDAFSKINDEIEITNGKLSISDLGDKVFFYAVPKRGKKNTTPGVEVWDTSDPLIHSRKKYENTGEFGPWLYVWCPKSNKVIPLGTEEFPKVVFNPNYQYALNFNVISNEPKFHYYPFIDIYALDTETAEKELIVKKQYPGIGYVHFSPTGNYFVYFKEKNWWLYNLKEKKHINLTQDLDAGFYKEGQYDYNNPQPYGLAGWSENDSEVFVYDRYDVWKISVNGTRKEKLTKGRESNTVFRIVTGNNDKKIRYDYIGFDTFTIDSKDGLLLSATNTKNLRSGFYQWKDTDNIREIVFKDRRLTNLFQLGTDSFIFKEQSLTIPSSVVYKNLKKKSSKTVFLSNTQWNQYNWPKKELIYYDTEIADSLKGVLIYPVNYNPEKKYPMIVSIYEEQSSYLHKFTPPSLFNENGFNSMNYALDDYFVLLPDIYYEKGKPGISALKCVEKAVKKVLETVPVDKKRIGLIGHSFGGYETAFIVTQTDLFAAAVSGAGIFNLLSFYFDIYKMTGHSEIIRVENNGLFRMQKSYFEDSETFMENSPLHNMAGVNTPLLIWAGKEDTNVNPNQSLQGYLALRRLRKPAKLIYYTGESHTLSINKNKKDLSKRIKNWFDTYLK